MCVNTKSEYSLNWNRIFFYSNWTRQLWSQNITSKLWSQNITSNPNFHSIRFLFYFPNTLHNMNFSYNIVQVCVIILKYTQLSISKLWSFNIEDIFILFQIFLIQFSMWRISNKSPDVIDLFIAKVFFLSRRY